MKRKRVVVFCFFFAEGNIVTLSLHSMLPLVSLFVVCLSVHIHVPATHPCLHVRMYSLAFMHVCSSIFSCAYVDFESM